MNDAQAIMKSPSLAAGFELGDFGKAPVAQVTHRVSVLEDEDGEAVSGFIIVGKNSPEFQEASSAVRIDNIKRSSKRKTQIDASTTEGAGVVARTVAANEKTIALAIVVGWFGFNLEGAELEFDKGYVEKLFAAYPQWQAKVNAALEADANFSKV